ncbi:MAG: hypothetical protein AAFP84_06665 [Actinomycetota bacterium]
MTEHTGRRVVADVPSGWRSIDPPDGFQLVVVEPDSHESIASNLTVQLQLQPAGPITAAAIDAYLTEVVDGLEASDGVDVVDVVVDHDGAAVPDQPTQRVLMHVDIAGETAEICQQHRWIDDCIVVSTVTVPLDGDPPVDVLLECLECIGVERVPVG